MTITRPAGTGNGNTPPDPDAAKNSWPEHGAADLGRGTPNVGGPVAAAWREGTLTRAQELKALCAWVTADNSSRASALLIEKIHEHLDAAREAAHVEALRPKRRVHLPRYGSLRERAMSNLDAAEAQLLNIAPAEYVLGQMSSVLHHVRRHLVKGDPRREELERITGRLGLNDPDHPPLQTAPEVSHDKKRQIVNQERGQIVSAMRAASSAALREQVRVRSFRDVIVATTIVLSLLAIAIAVIGLREPTLLPLCFAPEEAASTTVVCPTGQSEPFETMQPGGPPSDTSKDIDFVVRDTVGPWDLLIVELIGLAAGAIAAAAAIRKIRGSSERHGVPLALAALKLPTGALTAFLGLMLMRGQFVPGLSALDTPAQILAWALVFGYAQQLFTRLVDQQGQTVLDSVRGASKPTKSSATP